MVNTQVQYVSLILFYMMHTLRHRAHGHHLGAKSSTRFNRSVKLARPSPGSTRLFWWYRFFSLCHCAYKSPMSFVDDYPNDLPTEESELSDSEPAL